MKQEFVQLEERKKKEQEAEERVLERRRKELKAIPYYLRELIAPAMRQIMKGVMNGIEAVE